MLVVFQGLGQLQALHVVFGQRVVGRADTELHGHVQAGRSLAAARHADQDKIGLVVVVGARAVVVVEGKVDRLDALHIVGVAADRVGFAHRIRGMGGQFLLQRGQEGREDVDHETVGSGQHLADILVDDGVEDDWTDTVLFSGAIDLLYHRPRFFYAVDVRTREFIERNGIELR
ncbi:hypothetical protein D3C80_1545010 [compost metagenome]